MLLESLLLAGYSQAALSLTVTEKQKNASKKIHHKGCHDTLRKQLEFKGLLISD